MYVRACVCVSVCRYNVYQVSRALGLPRVNIVYMDGHTQSPMDEVWRQLGTQVSFIKHIPPHTCFSRAVFVPYGYAGCVCVCVCVRVLML